jgi:hypothetical protein
MQTVGSEVVVRFLSLRAGHDLQLRNISGKEWLTSSGTFRRLALVRTDVSEELSSSFIRVTKIGDLGTTLTVTSNRRALADSCHTDDGGGKFLRNVGSYNSHMA